MTVFSADLTSLKENFINNGPSSVGADLDRGESRIIRTIPTQATKFLESGHLSMFLHPYTYLPTPA